MKRILCAFLSASLAALPLLTQAAVLDKCSEDMDSQSLVLSGSSLLPEMAVLIKISADDSSGDGAEPDVIVSVETDESGAYSAKLQMPGEAASGTKLVTVVSEVGQRAETSIKFYSSSDIKTILDNWNDAVNDNDVSKMENVLNNKIALEIVLNPTDSALAADLSEYLATADKTALASSLIKLGTAEDIADFADGFKEQYIAYAVGALGDELFARLILEFEDEILSESEVYQNLLSDKTDDEKLAIYEDAASRREGDVTVDSAAELIYESVILDEFKSLGYYSEITPFVLEYNDDYFKIDFTDYDKLTNTYNVDSEIMKQMDSFDTFDEYRTLFNKLVKAEKSDESDSSSSKNSGGSSGSSRRASSSGSVSDYAPVVSVDDEVFTDLDGYEWAEDHIMSLYNAGVVDGVGSKLFSPSETVTREQFVKMLFALTDMPSEITDAGFADSVSGEWYVEYLNAAKTIGLVNGKDDGSFGVGESITRQDAAVMCLNAIKLENASLLDSVETSGLSFGDKGDIAPYALYAVTVLNKLGVLNGDGGNVMPTSFATRAEASVMIDRLLQALTAE